MNVVKARLSQFADYKRLSNRKFAKAVDASPNILSRGSSIVSSTLIQIGIVFPDLNMDWVINGRGNMLHESVDKDMLMQQVGKKYNEKPMENILADDGEAYTAIHSVSILPPFDKKPATAITISRDAFEDLASQLPFSTHVYLQVLLERQAEADAVRLGISVEAAKQIIADKVAAAGEGLNGAIQPHISQ
jgi:hypothetical protein